MLKRLPNPLVLSEWGLGAVAIADVDVVPDSRVTAEAVVRFASAFAVLTSVGSSRSMMSRSPDRRLASRTVEFGDGQVGDLVEAVGRLVPVVREPLQHDPVVLDALDELVGARANGLGAGITPARGGRLGREHHARAVRELRQHGHVGLRQVQLHGERVDDLDACDRGDLALAAGFGSVLARSMLNFTASALKGSPSWNLTPSRSLNVSDFVSAPHSQDVASAARTAAPA